MHELDTTTGPAAIAYIGATPWHGLGQKVDPNATPEEWREAAKLNWDAKRGTVRYNHEGEEEGHLFTFADKHVLYRSDTLAPLSVVSKDYQIVQPGMVMEFFGNIAAKGDFQIETVGALKAGRRIWALARVGENAKVLDDEIAPYLLLATSYDGSMATIAKFTSVRVVCQNTLSASLRNAEGAKTLSISHNTIWNPGNVRHQLGIALDSWDEFIINSKKLAGRKITDEEMDTFLQEMIEPPYGKTYTPDQVKASKGYQRIMSLFHGGQIGAGQDAVNGTAWGGLQALTQYIDHEKGRLQDNRLDNAWFGPGAKFKDKAMEVMMKVAA